MRQLLSIWCIVTTYIYITEAELVYEWDYVEYNWLSESMKEEYTNNESYILKNNIMAGIKVYDSRVFVTTPRLKLGVPSTLNEIIFDNVSNKYIFNPYPDWSMQDTNNCNALQSVQSMEINPFSGIMWIIDTGRKYFLELPNITNNDCPPKLILWDINNNQRIFTYIFPEPVVNYTNVWLNDIVLDIENDICYITDTYGNIPGGIVIYDYKNNQSQRFEDVTMKYDKKGSIATQFDIANYTIPNMTFAMDGIALTPTRDYIIYCPLSSYKLYLISTYDILNNIHDNITLLGTRLSQSDGITLSNTSSLYFGSFHQTAVYKTDDWINNDLNQQILIQNENELQWIDTFGWDNSGYLWFTTTRAQRFILEKTNYNDTNLRIFKIFVGESSYINYHDDDDDYANTHKCHNLFLVLFIIISFLI